MELPDVSNILSGIKKTDLWQILTGLPALFTSKGFDLDKLEMTILLSPGRADDEITLRVYYAKGLIFSKAINLYD